MSAKRKAQVKRRPKSPRIRRMDGARHWRKSVDRHLWLLLHAGVTPAQIKRSVAQILHKHRDTPVLELPTPEELEYSRILTQWRTQPEYVDDQGQLRSLRFAGAGPNFTSLVRQALPEANAADVLKLLTEYRIIKKTRDGRLHLLARAFVPKGGRREQFLAYGLMAVEGTLDSCFLNLRSGDPKECVGRLQQTAVAERFDMAYLPEFHDFLTDATTTFLATIDAWLKEHEVQYPIRPTQRVGYVGAGVTGFLAK